MKQPITIDTLEAYINLALRTESAEQEGWQAAIPRDVYRIQHALIGLTTEVSELLDSIRNNVDIVNLQEELGDLWWYTAILVDECGTPVDEVHGHGVFNNMDTSLMFREIEYLVILVGDWFDIVKRRTYYNAPSDHPRSTFERIDPKKLVAALCRLSFYSGIRVKDIWETNIQKLRTRYPDQFTTHCAIHRDEANERQALEGRQS